MRLQETLISCPYCGETFEVLLDESCEQTYYEDCQVCCRPILFILTEDNFGKIQLDIRRDDE